MKKKYNLKSSETGSVLIILLVLIFLIAAAGILFVWQNLSPRPFTPVELTQTEKNELEKKMSKLYNSAKTTIKKNKPDEKSDSQNDIIKPEPYSEKDADREIYLTEREINYFIKNRNMANRVAVDLSENQLSVKLVVPLDKSIPILGGTKLKLHLGTTLDYVDNNLVVIVNGISVGGIPIPSAWWGGIKNQNLVNYVSGNRKFFHILSAGVSDLNITNGEIYVKLRE